MVPKPVWEKNRKKKRLRHRPQTPPPLPGKKENVLPCKQPTGLGQRSFRHGSRREKRDQQKVTGDAPTPGRPGKKKNRVGARPPSSNKEAQLFFPLQRGGGEQEEKGVTGSGKPTPTRDFSSIKKKGPPIHPVLLGHSSIIS